MEKTDEPKKGVSVWVGIILMIAITIVTAATVYVYVSGTISPTKPYLEISVIPNGYPELYNDWDITVWKVTDPVNKTHIPGDNVSITTEIFNRNTKNKISEYKLTTNENGHCSFTYNNETQSYKFIANADGFRSAQFEPIIKYVSIDSISHISLLFNFASPFVTLVILITLLLLKNEPIEMRKRIYKIKRYLLNISKFTAFLLVIIITIGVILLANLNNTITSSGYPDSNIFFGLNLIFWISMILIITMIVSISGWLISPRL